MCFLRYLKNSIWPQCAPPPLHKGGGESQSGHLPPWGVLTKPYYHSFLSYGFLIKKVPVKDSKVVNLVTLQPGFQNLCLLGYLLILGDFKTVLANCRDLWFHPLNLCCPRPQVPKCRDVVYLDQRLGAAQSKGWSKQSFSAFLLRKT